MSIGWTEEQQQVIHLRNRNILVSAAAGSGKTAVLVERIITMITDKEKPLDIDRLLIVTFTSAAAAEMRERIGDAIEQKLDADPENIHLQRQSTLIHVAKITTIHSFCLHVIRNYSGQLDIDPSFRIGDEGELKLLRNDILEELLGDYYESEEENFSKFIETYASGKGDFGITDFILRLYDFSRSYPWPELWLKECQTNYEAADLESLMQTGWMHYLVEDIRLQVEELMDQWEYGMSLCKDSDGPYMYEKMFESDYAVLKLLNEAGNYLEINQVLKFLSFARMSPKKDESVQAEKRAMVASIRDHIKKALQKMKDFYHIEDPDTIPEDLEGSQAAIGMLIQLTREFSLRFQEKKREKNILDFNDLEHLALEVLVKEDHGQTILTEAAKELREQYEEILIDEYQDSNLVQETILTSISRVFIDQPNIFMVGDVKQSIYRFRLARPELFMDKYDKYTTEDGAHQKIELHKNFRSRSLVLSSINFIFYQIMKKALGNVEYNENAALNSGAVFSDIDEMVITSETELLITDLQEDLAVGKSKEAIEQTDYTTREIEAKMIATRIRELTDQENGYLVWDKKIDAYRIAEYRDIVILLRSLSGWSDVFVRVLMNEGIPAFAQSQTGYFTTLEVQTVLCLLQVIDNPMDDIPLAAVLKSPIVGLTSEELAIVAAVFKRNGKSQGVKGFYGAWQYYMEFEKGEPALQKKLSDFWMQLNHFRKLGTYRNLHDLLYQILEESGYYAYVAALPQGENRKANLDMLIEKAVSYESTSYHGLFHFIRYIEKLQKYNTDYGEASLIGEHDNTVRIMSIHKSKGLEFPIVLLSGMNKAFNKLDAYNRILLHPEMGIATDFVDLEKRVKTPTLMKKVFRRRLELEDMGEELRVLYVALTRAKEKLIMTGVVKGLEDRRAKYANSVYSNQRSLPFTLLSTAGSYLDWVLMSLGRPALFPEQEKLFSIKVYPLGYLLGEEIERQTEDEIAKNALLAMDLSEAFDEEIYKNLEGNLLYSYPHLAAVSTHTKMSVSELKQYGQKMEEEESDVLFIGDMTLGEDMELAITMPQFMQEGLPLKGASRGSAYHRILELLDYSEMKELSNLSRLLEDLKGEEKISQAVYEAISLKSLEIFFESDIGKRMIASANKLQKEKRFVIGVEEEISREMVLIQGIIDAFFEEDGELVLVDYKTDYMDSGNESDLIRRYGVQLEYYKKALERITGKRVKEVFIYSFSIGKAIPVYNFTT